MIFLFIYMTVFRNLSAAMVTSEVNPRTPDPRIESVSCPLGTAVLGHYAALAFWESAYSLTRSCMLSSRLMQYPSSVMLKYRSAHVSQCHQVAMGTGSPSPYMRSSISLFVARSRGKAAQVSPTLIFVPQEQHFRLRLVLSSV